MRPGTQLVLGGRRRPDGQPSTLSVGQQPVSKMHLIYQKKCNKERNRWVGAGVLVEGEVRRERGVIAVGEGHPRQGTASELEMGAYKKEGR